MGGSARFNADNTGRQSFEKCFHAGSAKLPAQHCAPGLVDRMDLKNVFGEIKTYDSNRHLDGPRNVALQLRPTLWHSMPVAAVVHTITSYPAPIYTTLTDAATGKAEHALSTSTIESNKRCY
jgi:hypothetical protein